MSGRSNQHLFKVILVGDAEAGKTAMITRFAVVNSNAPEPFVSTIGVDFKVRDMAVSGMQVRLQLWDTSSTFQPFNITSSYYRGTRGVLLVYDVTSERSFKNIRNWVIGVKEQSNPNTTIVLIANSCHLNNHDRQVEWERGKQLADELGINRFIEVSSVTGKNTEEALTIITKDMLAQESSETASTSSNTSTKATKCLVQ